MTTLFYLYSPAGKLIVSVLLFCAGGPQQIRLAHVIHKFQGTPSRIRRDIVFERILLPIFLQHMYMNSRGKSPRSAAGMSEDAIFRLILITVVRRSEQSKAFFIFFAPPRLFSIQLTGSLSLD